MNIKVTLVSIKSNFTCMFISIFYHFSCTFLCMKSAALRVMLALAE